METIHPIVLLHALSYKFWSLDMSSNRQSRIYNLPCIDICKESYQVCNQFQILIISSSIRHYLIVLSYVHCKHQFHLTGAACRRAELPSEFKKYVSKKSYLIVIDDIHTVEEWSHIKTLCFPHNKKGSRIIVSTEHVEVASLYVGPENIAPEHKQLFADLYVFYEKGSQDGTHSTEAGCCSNTVNINSSNSDCGKSLNEIQTAASFKESEPIGREEENSDIIKLIINEDSQHLEVITVWGMGGLGKTTLVRNVYQSKELSGMFEKRACVTIMRPFDPEMLMESLAMQLDPKYSEHKGKMSMLAGKTKPKVEKSLADCIEGKKYLIVIDDLSSTTEWDAIKLHFLAAPASRIIVTTRVESIAKHCSKKQKNIYNLQLLEYKNARNLLAEKTIYIIGHRD